MSSDNIVSDGNLSGTHGAWLWAAIPALLLLGVIGYAQFSVGALYVVEFSADNAFLMDTTARVSLGQVPHVDFSLHLGALPFYVIAAVDALLPGQAFLVAQCVYVFACLLVAMWLVRTRLAFMSGTVLMLAIVLQGTAITGAAAPEVTLVAFYNRWAWLAAYLFLVAVLIDHRDGRISPIDGGLVGALAFVLFATKITFFVALVPIGLARYIAAGRWREVSAALAVFLALVAGGMLIDPMIWVGYARDLIWVAGNPLRPAAGLGFVEMLTAPVLVYYSLAFLGFLVGLYWSFGGTVAVWFLLAGLGLAFVQYQNFQNAPFWVLFLAVAAWVFASRTDISRTMRAVWVLFALGLTLMGARLLYPMTLGTVVNQLAADTGLYQPFLANTAAIDGFYFVNELFEDEASEVEAPDGPIPPYAGAMECDHGELWAGHFVAQAEAMADLAGPVFVTDSISPHWLAAGQPPLTGAAVWNYGSLKGLANAEFVLVPVCAVKPDHKREILRAIVRNDISLETFRETDAATIYKVVRTGSGE